MTEETYNKIIRTAYRLFAEDGYDATGMMKIAKEAGVSKGAIYHHFESKQMILLKVCSEFLVNQFLDESLKVDHLNQQNFKKELERQCVTYISKSKRDPLRKKFGMQLFTAVGRIENLDEMLEPLMGQVYELVNSIIEKGIEYGHIDKDIDRDLLVQKLFLIFDALELYAAFDFPFRLEDLMASFIQDIFK